jgi:acyl carrier protein
MNEPILAKVETIAADLFDVPRQSITPQSSPKDIEKWDSVQHLNLVLALEQQFGIQFDPEEIEQMSSIERVAKLVAMKGGDKS